jgi:hypothetical protein
MQRAFLVAIGAAGAEPYDGSIDLALVDVCEAAQAKQVNFETGEARDICRSRNSAPASLAAGIIIKSAFISAGCGFLVSLWLASRVSSPPSR